MVKRSASTLKLQWNRKDMVASIPTNDLWIAALARQHQLQILSRDTHFDFIEGIVRIGW
jgi:predicted nucleic acid-binding protein